MKFLINYKYLGVTSDAQNLYIRAHPVVFWLSVGLAIEGFIGAFLPHLLLLSAVNQALPNWLERVFYLVYMIGGAGSVVGQLRCKAWLESAGMTLVATGTLVQ